MEMDEIKKKRKTLKNKIKYIVCDINTASKILPVKKIETDTKIKKRLQNRKSGCIMKIEQKIRITGGDRYGISGNIT